MKHVLVIRTLAGLGNRLQELLSHRLYAIENNYDLIYFFWTNTTHCTYIDIDSLITHIPDVILIDSCNYHKKDKITIQIYNFIVKNKLNSSYDVHDHRIYTIDNTISIKFAGGCGPNRLFLNINPNIIHFNDDLRKEVDNYIKKTLNNKYIAIHLRVQDNNLYIDHNFIQKLLDSYSEYNIYISTDDINTQNKYKNLYKNVFINNNITNGLHKNRTLIKDAIFDMLVCSKASVFCGTSNLGGCNSSFSNIIYGFRELDGYKNAWNNSKNHLVSIKQD